MIAAKAYREESQERDTWVSLPGVAPIQLRPSPTINNMKNRWELTMTWRGLLISTSPSISSFFSLKVLFSFPTSFSSFYPLWPFFLVQTLPRKTMAQLQGSDHQAQLPSRLFARIGLQGSTSFPPGPPFPY